MVHTVDDRLRDEARRHRFVFGCRECAHFGAAHAQPARPVASPGCSLGFPVEPHLDVDLESAREVVFCKAFELV